MFDPKSKPIQKSDWIATSKADRRSSEGIEESIDSQSKQNKEIEIKSLEVIEASRKALALSGAKPNQISTDPTLRLPPNNKRINRNIKPNWDESKKSDHSMMRASDTVPVQDRSIENKPISIKPFSSDAEEKDPTVELQVKPIERVKDRLEKENNNLPLQIKPIERVKDRLEKENNNLPLQIKPIERVKDRLEKELDKKVPLQVKPIARVKDRLEKEQDKTSQTPALSETSSEIATNPVLLQKIAFSNY